MKICPHCKAISDAQPIPAFLDIQYEKCDLCFLCVACRKKKTAFESRFCPSCKYLRIRPHILEYIKRPEVKAKRREWYARTRTWATTISGRISAQIRGALGRKKQGHWENIVGYTKHELRAHIEKQFRPGMTWENRAKWHIDHIVPIASFKRKGTLLREIKVCWGLANLRPVWRLENQRKHDKLEFLL